MRLRPSVVLDRERKIEELEKAARLVDQIEVDTPSRGDDGHPMRHPKLRENLSDTLDLDRPGQQEVLVDGVAPGTMLADALFGDTSGAGQLPARAALSHMVEIGVLAEVHTELAQSFARGLEIPSLGVDQDTVMIPEEILPSYRASPPA